MQLFVMNQVKDFTNDWIPGPNINDYIIVLQPSVELGRATQADGIVFTHAEVERFV